MIDLTSTTPINRFSTNMKTIPKMSARIGKPQVPNPDVDSKSNPNFFEAFRTSLPLELRQIVYNYLYADCNLTEEEQDLIKSPNAKTQIMLLSSNNHSKIERWLQKASVMTIINTLKSVSDNFEEELTAYEALKSRRTCPRIILEIIWLEDLGKLLKALGTEGRKNITSLRLSWDDLTRANLWAGGHSHQSKEFQGHAGMARVFELLADCPNLQSLEMQFDSVVLAGRGLGQLRELESWRAFEEIRLGTDAYVDLEYHISYGTRYYGRGNLDSARLGDLKRSLLRPREGGKALGELGEEDIRHGLLKRPKKRLYQSFC